MTAKNEALRAEARSANFRIACVESAAECIGRLGQGSRVIALTKGQFSMLDLIRAVLAQTGPAHLTLSTWTMGIRDIENAAWLLSTDQLTGFKLLTDRSFAVRQPRYCARLIKLFGEDCIRSSHTHAKFAIIRNPEWAVCVRGSMNLNKNVRWENFDLDVDPAICDFFALLVAELEALTPAGTNPGNAVVHDVFHQALEAHTCGDARVLAMTKGERLARLGYTRGEILRRHGEPGGEFERGSRALEDDYREGIVLAASKGDTQARTIVAGWIDRQKT